MAHRDVVRCSIRFPCIACLGRFGAPGNVRRQSPCPGVGRGLSAVSAEEVRSFQPSPYLRRKWAQPGVCRTEEEGCSSMWRGVPRPDQAARTSARGALGGLAALRAPSGPSSAQRVAHGNESRAPGEGPAAFFSRGTGSPEAEGPAVLPEDCPLSPGWRRSARRLPAWPSAHLAAVA
jgi:hypothetical protein